jgi:hypothetical protein
MMVVKKVTLTQRKAMFPSRNETSTKEGRCEADVVVLRELR